MAPASDVTVERDPTESLFTLAQRLQRNAAFVLAERAGGNMTTVTTATMKDAHALASAIVDQHGAAIGPAGDLAIQARLAAIAPVEEYTSPAAFMRAVAGQPEWPGDRMPSLLPGVLYGPDARQDGPGRTAGHAWAADARKVKQRETNDRARSVGYRVGEGIGCTLAIAAALICLLGIGAFAVWMTQQMIGLL